MKNILFSLLLLNSFGTNFPLHAMENNYSLKRKFSELDTSDHKKPRLAIVLRDYQPEIKSASNLFRDFSDQQDYYSACTISAFPAQKSVAKFKTEGMQPFQYFIVNIENDFRNNKFDFYNHIEKDITAFVEYLKLKCLCTKAINEHDLQECEIDDIEPGVSDVINRYVNLVQFFFHDKNAKLNIDNYCFTVANRFFNFCYKDSYAVFEKLLNNKNYHPAVRLMHSLINVYFSQSGWQDWSVECLAGLNKEASAGKRVVYIAGGCDIEALLDEGIYNITIIDPFLPSQKRFYVTDFEWLLSNTKTKSLGMGDRIVFGKQHIAMQRSSYSEHNTTWKVLDLDNKEQLLGTVEFERRFCTEKDFSHNENKVILLAFNELYFVSLSDVNEGWGIGLNKIHADSKIYIKQLHEPINREVIINMRRSKNSQFSFCELASDVT